MEQDMRYRFPDKVRVLPTEGLGRFFVRKERRTMMNQVGTIIHAEIGKFSKQPLYTVSFESGKPACFFEDELEPTAKNA